MTDVEFVKKMRERNLESKEAILPNDRKWSEKVTNYNLERTSFNFTKSDYPERVTHKYIKEEENSFHPITQRYSDKVKDNTIAQNDKKNSINDMSKAYDNELSLESTYNLINLRNKLKGLNYSEDKYVHHRRVKNESDDLYFKPYNIITNNSFKVQHYLPPNMRDKFKSLEKCKEGIMPMKNKRNYDIEKYNRDYNIISNKYNTFHKEKEQAEKEIQTLEAAKKVQSLQTYDIIKRKFINPEIEEKFRKIYEQNQKKKINEAFIDKIKNKNYIVSNPISSEVYDHEAQKKLDERDFEKLEKFRTKYKIESLYRTIDENNDAKHENKFKTLNKPCEYKIVDDRGYNIVNHTIFTEGSKTNRFKKYKIMSDWEKLKTLADERNSTFDKKLIYKSMYDKSDVNENYKNYLLKRRQKLQDLKPLDEDPIFKISLANEKLKNPPFTKTFNMDTKRSNTIENDSRKDRKNIIYNFKNNIFMNKKDFYETNRNILDYDNKSSIPIRVDKNVNTRFFKHFLTKLGKKNNKNIY